MDFSSASSAPYVLGKKQLVVGLYPQVPQLKRDDRDVRRQVPVQILDDRADHGGDLNWVGYDKLTPLDAARRSGAHDLAAWLEANGAHNADQVGPTDTTGTGRSS